MEVVMILKLDPEERVLDNRLLPKETSSWDLWHPGCIFKQIVLQPPDTKKSRRDSLWNDF